MKKRVSKNQKSKIIPIIIVSIIALALIATVSIGVMKNAGKVITGKPLVMSEIYGDDVKCIRSGGCCSGVNGHFCDKCSGGLLREYYCNPSNNKCTIAFTSKC